MTKSVQYHVLIQEKPELAQLLNSIAGLRTILYRLAVLLDSESIEIVTYAQAVLKTISDEINQVLNGLDMQMDQEQLQRWDNEGGRIESLPASVTKFMKPVSD
jgi:hypothetical protein